MIGKTPLTIAYGDGIGPEIMEATLTILTAAGAQLEPEVIELGQKMYLAGYSSGIPEVAWQSLKRTQLLLKGPITTPQGGGYKSLNVTLRKTLGLYANVRPCVAYAPYITTYFPKMDLVIIRENEEDTYTGIEYRQTEEVYQCLKLVTRPGCERIIRYAFEYARQFNRKKVTCFTKDNIMKMTDGLFHQVFNEIAVDYPEIAQEHFIVDIGSARLATQPELFDVIVTLNLYGDILSDVTAQMAGSVGLAGSANIGTQATMFEAIHGSAPDIAGKNRANPSGLLQAATQMLVYINQIAVAERIENAWLATLEAGIHTADIYSDAHSKQRATTAEFVQAVIARLGEVPKYFKAATYQEKPRQLTATRRPLKQQTQKQLVGVDIFIENAPELSIEQLVEIMSQCKSVMTLTVITSLGVKLWPAGETLTPYLGHCCCRFQTERVLPKRVLSKPTLIHYEDILLLLQQFNQAKLIVIKTENLYMFDNQLGFTLAQGQ